MVAQLIGLIVSIALALLTPAYAGFPSSSSKQNATVYNFMTMGAGAHCDGATDDGPAFSAASAIMRANSTVTAGRGVTLILPSGRTCLWHSCPAASDGRKPFGGIPNLTFIATGVTIDGAGGCGNFGVGAVDFTCNGFTPLVNQPLTCMTDTFPTNSVGDTCVTLDTHSNAAHYVSPPHLWVIVAGLGMQTTSFPPNYAQWEYQQVLSANASSGVVCFTRPLANSYPSNVPDLVSGPNAGNLCSNTPCGGPGRIFPLVPIWDTTWHYIGGTWSNMAADLAWQARTVINENMTWTSGDQQCWLPSFIQTAIILNNTTTTCSIEADKEVDSVVINGGNIVGSGSIVFQSSSIHYAVVNNNAQVRMIQTPQNVVCNNAQLNSLSIGSTYGYTRSFAGNNCVFPNGISCCSNNGFTPLVACNPNVFPFQCYVYQGSGLFTRDESLTPGNPGGGCHAMDPPRFNAFGTDANGNWGQVFYVSGNQNNAIGFGFQVTGASYDAPNCSWHMQTNSALANVSSFSDTPNGAVSDQSRGWTCNNCTGSADAIDYSQAAAQNVPLFSQSSRTYTCLNNVPNIAGSIDINAMPAMSVNGLLNSVKFNVTTADTNEGGHTGFVQTRPWTYQQGAQTPSLPTIQIDTSYAGLRTLTSTSGNNINGVDNLPPGGLGAGTYIGFTTFTPTASGITNGPAAGCPVLTVTWDTTR